MRIIFIILFCSSFGSFAQQTPQYSQWYLHQFANNAAHAGIKQCIDAHVLYRAQWLDVEGAPNSGFLTLSIPLQTRRRRYLSARHGTGFRFETDRIGGFNTNRINLAYAAHFNFNKYDRLSLGLYAGILQTGYDPSDAITSTPDPEVMQQSNFIDPDASFGAWFNSQNYYLGLILKHLFPNDWRDIGTESRYYSHLLLNGGYRFSVGENFGLVPHINLRFAPKSPLSTDINLYGEYANKIGFGAGIRLGDALNVLLNIKIKEQFSITYSYDYSITDIQKVAKNTHEIGFRFTTCKESKSGTSDCPLFE